MTKPMFSVVVGALVSGGLLAVALRNVDFHALRETLTHARPGWVLALAMCAALMLAIRAWRWRLLLPSGLPFTTYFRLITIGLAVNNVLPLRLGEVARALLAAEKLDKPFVTVLASVLIERLLDAVTILGIAIAATGLYTDIPAVLKLRTALIPLFAGSAAAVIIAFVGHALLERSKFLTRALDKRPRVKALVGQVILGFKPLRSPAALLPILASGGALWLLDGGNYFIGAKAVPLGVDLPYSYAIVVLASAGFSTVVPSLPGYFGAYELVVSQALLPLGAAQDRAFGYALVVHSVSYLFTTALGLWFLYRDGTSLLDVWRRAREKH